MLLRSHHRDTLPAMDSQSGPRHVPHPTPTPRAGVTPGPTGERTEEENMSGIEGSPTGGWGWGAVSTSQPQPPTRTQANASLAARAPIPGGGRLTTCSVPGRQLRPGPGRGCGARSGGWERGARPAPPGGPPFSPSQGARPPGHFPHSPPHGPETQKVCFSWLCAPLRQLRPRPSGWARRLLALSLSLSFSFFPVSAFFPSNSPRRVLLGALTLLREPSGEGAPSGLP